MIEFLQSYQTIIHYSLHFLVPGLLGYVFFRKFWIRAWLIMIATMAVDLDHLLASPLFDPTRCSIGFHTLHTIPAIIFYMLLFFVPNKYVKVVALGLIFHMVADWFDCFLM